MRQEREAENTEMKFAQDEEQVGIVMQMLAEGMDPGYIQGAVDSGQISPRAANIAMQRMQENNATGDIQAGSGGVNLNDPNKDVTNASMQIAMNAMQGMQEGNEAQMAGSAGQGRGMGGQGRMQGHGGGQGRVNMAPPPNVDMLRR